jgi:hypothetical protein
MRRTKSIKRIEKKRPMDQNIETNKEIVESMNFIELSFNVKKRGMRMKMGHGTYKKNGKKGERQTTKIE